MSGLFRVLSHWPDDFAWIVGRNPETGEPEFIDIFGGAKYRIVYATPRPWTGRSGNQFLTFEIIEGTFSAEDINLKDVRLRVRCTSRGADAMVLAPRWPLEISEGDELHLIEYGDIHPVSGAPGRVL